MKALDASIVVIGLSFAWNRIHILGGGPAGSAAALAALRHGSGTRVRVIEKSRLPRHKVCGEFFSPEIGPELELLGAWDAFLAAGPAAYAGLRCISAQHEELALAGTGFWAEPVRIRSDAARPGTHGGRGTRERICAKSRLDRRHGPPVHAGTTGSARGQRLFGFKAHFEGPVDDAVELFFFERCYVGVSCIEAGKTNVCGLAPESFLSRFGFEYDGIVMHCPALSDRLKPLRRVTPWFSTGPLQYGQAFANAGPAYPAGDALSFVDPFTGSGLLAAVRSGAMAGKAAAIGQPVAEYLRECRASLRQPFQVAGVLRRALEGGWAERLLPLAPARLLFALTRPK